MHTNGHEREESDIPSGFGGLALADRDVGSILPDPKVMPVPEMGSGVTGLMPVGGEPRETSMR